MNRRDEMTLAEQTARRLLLAGIKSDDPGLVAIREWNAAVYERDGLPNPHEPPENRSDANDRGEAWPGGAGMADERRTPCTSAPLATAQSAENPFKTDGTPTTSSRTRLAARRLPQTASPSARDTTTRRERQ